MKPSLRHADRPSKQLLWIWLRNDMANSSAFKRGLDIACAEMENFRFFQTISYTGVDIDAERLEAGAKANPGATAIHSSIENMPPTLQGDFVVCVQTIGTNKLFRNDQTMTCVKKIVAATATGGTLLFNIGPDSLGYAGEVEEVLRTSFGRLRKRSYGAFVEHVKSPTMSLAIARAMQVFPLLRRTQKRPFIYYNCSQRLPVPIEMAQPVLRPALASEAAE
jgi:hypothetical protein